MSPELKSKTLYSYTFNDNQLFTQTFKYLKTIPELVFVFVRGKVE